MCLESHKVLYFSLLYLFAIISFQCNAQDPWDIAQNNPTSVDDRNIPPDLRMTPKKRTDQTDNNYGIGEWFYRRILGIVLKGGQVKENEDGSVDISLQMKLDQKQWNTLEEYITSTSALSEDKFRRSLGYIEQSIYEPSLPTKIILAWSDYIQMFLADYKTEITWTTGLLAVSVLLFWLWRHMSHRNMIITVFIILYAYEVLVSYKEAEQNEIEKFVAAVNSCKWHVWSSKCELPKPDPVIFLKHMNPSKIGVRMFTSIITEPVIVLSETVRTMTHGITDGLWYPFDVIMYGILITIFNIILLIFLITIVFNFVLNIPINLSFGLFSVCLRQRKRSMFSDKSDLNQNNSTPNRTDNTNTISGATLDKLLDVFARAINAPNRNNVSQHVIQNDTHSTQRALTNSTKNTGLKRSASTGRLPNPRSFGNCEVPRRNIGFCVDGGGDAR